MKIRFVTSEGQLSIKALETEKRTITFLLFSGKNESPDTWLQSWRFSGRISEQIQSPLLLIFNPPTITNPAP
ncbi:hypothetical protein BWI93_08330 [Siphonobacter sp. BAB-5385]|nr:hypothetical protein BWI93_08330 [Siphonobacter sp. BAB-5385]